MNSDDPTIATTSRNRRHLTTTTQDTTSAAYPFPDSSTGIRKRRPSDELIPDASAIFELEAHARSIASGLDMALRDLRGSLRGMSDLTCESMQVFGSVVNATCEQVDTAIRSTYTMLAKTEEFNKSMRETQKLLQQM